MIVSLHFLQRFSIVPFLGLAILIGCGGKDEADGKQQSLEDATEDSAVAGTDVMADTDVFALDFIALDVPQCPGASGCDCMEDADCNLGVCLETELGLRCAKACETGCASDEVCLTSATASDPVHYCAPKSVRQCAPCATATDCVTNWSAASVCADGGASGSFCAATCKSHEDCPQDLRCQPVIVGGASQLACAPQAGIATCTCNAWGYCRCSNNQLHSQGGNSIVSRYAQVYSVGPLSLRYRARCSLFE
jgi:hypothetical protein